MALASISIHCLVNYLRSTVTGQSTSYNAYETTSQAKKHVNVSHPCSRIVSMAIALIKRKRITTLDPPARNLCCHYHIPLKIGRSQCQFGSGFSGVPRHWVSCGRKASHPAACEVRRVGVRLNARTR
ncbi:hypothetical protein F5B21DRAFT_456711 [Xylaria acuta]|nr:hypothetical protein F5B21DRAFT_456711 [Xylaria acuta]